MAIERVSIGRLKARLSEYVRRARAGEAVVITDRGRPVARLSPLAGAAELEGRMAELRRAGLIRAPEASLDLEALLTAELPRDPTGRGVEAVLEERADSW
jgi:prevent-host-death family protein